MRELHRPHPYMYKKMLNFWWNQAQGVWQIGGILKQQTYGEIKNDKNLDTAREDFHKVIILVTHREEEKLPLVYVYFYFDGKEHDLEPVPCHGNNLKKDKPRHSTNVSVRQKIRKLLTQGLKRK